MNDVQRTHASMFEDVDNYMMKTDTYTTYYKKEEGGGPFDFRSAVQVSGQGRPMGADAMQNQADQYAKIGEIGSYAGTETVNGTECHVIRVSEPGQLDESLRTASEVTYFIGVGDNYMRRMSLRGMTPQGDGGMTMDMKDYRTVDGVSLPFRMEIRMDVSEEQRKQMEQMKKQMENMPEAQRESMEKMMGDQMRRLMNDEPIVITVTEVVVNGPIPYGVF